MKSLTSSQYKSNSRISGRLYKKIRGKRHYFGYVKDWHAAVDLYTAQRDDLHAGKTPRKTGEGLTVRDLCNQFLTSKARQQEAGELSPRSFLDYKRCTDRIVRAFGKQRLVEDLAADDFELLRADIADGCGRTFVGNEVQRTRTVFKYAYIAFNVYRRNLWRTALFSPRVSRSITSPIGLSLIMYVQVEEGPTKPSRPMSIPSSDILA